MLDMMTFDYILHNQWYRLTFVNFIQIKKSIQIIIFFFSFNHRATDKKKKKSRDLTFTCVCVRLGNCFPKKKR